jgi:hypothetical protein
MLDSDVAGDKNLGERLPMKLFSNMDSQKRLASSFSDPIGVEEKENDGNMASTFSSSVASNPSVLTVSRDAKLDTIS